MSEHVNIPAESVRAISFVAGYRLPGDWIPAGVYQVLRKPNGVFESFAPAGQDGRDYSGSYYFPLEGQQWNQ